MDDIAHLPCLSGWNLPWSVRSNEFCSSIPPTMLLSHRIRIEATSEQRDYFARAAGTARRVWNFALAECQRMVSCGQRPDVVVLKKQFNAIKYTHSDWLDSEGKPWLRTIHRDAHAQPFANLGSAWGRYFSALKAGKPAHPPAFKRKGRCRDSFYVANDRLRLEGKSAILPKVGRALLAEALRLPGKIMGASVSREANHWFLAVQVDVFDDAALLPRSADSIVGVDLGITVAATLSSGEKLAAPLPLSAELRRMRIRSRRQSRKLQAAKAGAEIAGEIPKGTRLTFSQNRKKGAHALACLHTRIARVRSDFLHKLTTRLCRENQAVAIEDLCVKGMMANSRMARAISDIGFYEFRRQLQYKALRYGTTIVVADRWYPSSKLCSHCGAKNSLLGLGELSWTCICGAYHDRDVNAAVNLHRLATGALAAAMALPVASQAVTPGTAAGRLPAEGGKVTPVRNEYGRQDGSGQEEDGANVCTPS
ncbi:transposase [Massilia sp. LC238]|uniref:RNA-guided endonuclease InsQ/TnpB family protein n=1 Tax=Massilia sp. LC238 TaxID=1502852 RepID=UPI0004E4308C|nr:transposase [Massilia sp. LC238]KFC74255.1 IS605 OrfB family transposase [Massilia sp. LC238]